MNRTAQALEKLFEASRRRQQRLKEQETKKYRKAQESTKKDRALQQSTDKEITSQDVRKWHLEVYRTRYVERCPSDDELYQTREELEEAEPNSINWDVWDRLVKKTKQQLYEKERKRTTTREARMLSNDV